MNRTKRSLIAVVGIGLGLLLPLQVAAAEGPDLRSLAAEWWQWVLSIPPSENPMLDATGAKCVVGQRGSTWFLAGSLSGGAATRACTVPAGVTLFFPVANNVFFDAPNVCGQGPDPFPVAAMRAGIGEVIDGVIDLSVELDGKPVKDVQRVRSRVFELALPEANVLDAACGGLPGGIYSPAVDDGYYVRLKPLKPGEHTLHFHSEQPDFGFVIDTTYHLSVVPVARR